MKIISANELSSYRRSLGEVDKKYFDRVEKIVRDIEYQGDKALREYTRKLDKVKGDISFFVSKEEILQAEERVLSEFSDIYRYFQNAAHNIENFHRHQITESWHYHDRGNLYGQDIRPLERVGVYVPGGRAFYPSSVLMNLIPAKVAGVKDITLATPPNADGQIHPLLICLAKELGATRILKAGGAQAIAALAYGTESVHRVDKITGPGNTYVMLAKRLLMGVVGIDSIAGPSEVAILSDGKIDPRWVAYDLCAQAEHSDGTAVFLISNDEDFIKKVSDELEILIPRLERGEIIRKSIEKDSFAVIVDNIEQGFEIVNQIAPEHLEVQCDMNAGEIMKRVRNAGAVFIGNYTPVATGDYYAGPNHVLPTNGTAVFSSPLGVYDFVKRTSYLQLNHAYLESKGHQIEAMARFEGLEAHALSIKARMRDEK